MQVTPPLGKLQDRVTDQLSRPVVGRLAAALDLDHGHLHLAGFSGRRPTPHRDDGVVFRQNEHVTDATRDPSVDEVELEASCLLVFRTTQPAYVERSGRMPVRIRRRVVHG